MANLKFCFSAKCQILALANKILKSTCQKKAISGITDKRVNNAPKNRITLWECGGMVDATDLKSVDFKRSWGFKSPPSHVKNN